VGRLHGYEGLHPREVVLPVVAAALAGTENFLLTNASGSLKRNFKTGSIMVIRDHVNMTGTTPLWGPNPENGHGLALGPRFPDMSAVWDAKLNDRLKKLLKGRRFAVNDGLYLGLSGPAYETPAEVKLFSMWGLGAVGMSTVWEAQALRHMGRTIGGISFISNMGCGLVKKVALNHEDVEKEGRKIAQKLVESLFLFAAQECAPAKARAASTPQARKGRKK
jgi:purine-nucleoside phosphorylase